MVNGYITYTGTEGFEISIYGKNLTDERYRVSAATRLPHCGTSAGSGRHRVSTASDRIQLIKSWQYRQGLWGLLCLVFESSPSGRSHGHVT